MDTGRDMLHFCASNKDVYDLMSMKDRNRRPLKWWGRAGGETWHVYDAVDGTIERA